MQKPEAADVSVGVLTLPAGIATGTHGVVTPLPRPQYILRQPRPLGYHRDGVARFGLDGVWKCFHDGILALLSKYCQRIYLNIHLTIPLLNANLLGQVMDNCQKLDVSPVKRVNIQNGRFLMKNTSLFAVAVVTALFTLPMGASAQHTMQKEKAPMKNIVEIATEAGSFKTLVAAVKAAGLVETLSGPGPFTVFAPTDEAFAKLPAGTVEALLADKAKLASILTFHVVAGKVMAADTIKANGARPTTVNGLPVDIVVRDGKVYVNGAQVVTADIVASNGVIHVIDAVLIPTAAPVAVGR